MKTNMRFIAGNIIDDVLYFSSTLYNALFSIDLYSKELTFIGSFKDVSLDRVILHRKCLVYHRWLIFIPQNNDSVHLVNADTFEQKTIRVLDEDKFFMFSDAFVIEDCIYILPAKKEQPALIIHLDDFKVEKMDLFNEWIKKEIPDSPHESGIISISATLQNDSIYMGLFYQNKLIKYDLNSGSIKLIETDVEKIWTISAGENGIWVTDLSHGYAELINDNKTRFELDHNRNYRHIIDMGDKFYAIPGSSANIKLIKRNHAPKELDYPDEYKDMGPDNYDKFYSYLIYSNRIYLFPHSHNGILVIQDDELTDIPAEYEFDPYDKSSEEFLKVLCARGDYLYKEAEGIITEHPLFDLESFLEWTKRQ